MKTDLQKTGVATQTPISSNSTLADSTKGTVVVEGDELWYEIRRADLMKPFLMTMASDSDHWLFLMSNGAMTAGRVNPDKALLPYYTQDKLSDMKGCSGSTTILRIYRGDGDAIVWEPFSDSADWDSTIHRHVRKNQLGNHIVLEEDHSVSQLTCRLSWRPSEQFGFIRRMEILNKGTEAVRLEVLDGLCNVLPAGLEQRFQNEFSILGDAYKQCELVAPENMGVYHLSSVPTDLAEPMESLQATVVWQTGLEEATYILSETQITEFRRTGNVVEESQIRGKRGAYLTVSEHVIPAGESKAWYVCADVYQDSSSVEALKDQLSNSAGLNTLIEEDCRGTEERMKQMLAASDGFQTSADLSRSMRHTSNTLFNLMRGGSFPTGYQLPLDDLLETVAHFNSEAEENLKALLGEDATLTCSDPWDSQHALAKGNPDLLRLLREYLPLSFSRRHGDPSRPWNRFSIEIKEADGSPRFYYQGNWRDIFQNWEALLHAYPEYAEAAICRFLNASTADGYNPYRVTKDGFDWEIIEPSDPWANIGYWGDHQIVYLLRLLETSVKFHPGRLSNLLKEETFVYAEVPYQIRPYDEILKNPRETVDYDTESEARINARVKEIGADGKLLCTHSGNLLHVSLIEKLLNPLLAKLSNFIPGGGIWMNTQRPEWNDANNALVGYGVSVVTLGYIARYLRFLLTEFSSELEGNAFNVSNELAALLKAQHDVFSKAPATCSPQERQAIVQSLGQPASDFRQMLYKNGLSGEKVELAGSEIVAFLKGALDHANECLMENKRQDSLWHSYNLLKPTEAGFEVNHLVVMLEGQVSILSSGLLDAKAGLELLQSLRKSPLYREDQSSYILYPNRDMPSFLKKNRVQPAKAEAIPLLKKMMGSGDTRLIRVLKSGEVSFNGSFNNKGDLDKALSAISGQGAQQAEIEASRLAVLDLFEDAFNHHSFTGRSGTFFAYEGLGSIYWHMVSKLALAVLENYCDLKDTSSPEQAAELLQWFREIRDGLGVDKNPAHYGAFPTDAYSHTPAHAGAQQPGMTGQVKEDVLIRIAELGVFLDHGRIGFRTDIIEEKEFLKNPISVPFKTVTGEGISIDLEPGSLAFSFCQVPVIYKKDSGKTGVIVHLSDGSQKVLEERLITEELSREIFMRTGKVSRIDVNLV